MRLPPRFEGLRPRAVRRGRGLALCALVAAAACLTPGEPPTLRYFSPESSAREAGGGETRTGSSEVQAAPQAEAPASTSPRQTLRLRHFRAAAQLGERWVWRDGVEFGFAEELRWTDLPITYLERALSEALFQERGLRRSEAGSSPVLDIELTAFDWLPKAAEVRLELTLRVGWPAVDGSFEELRLVQVRAVPGGPDGARGAAIARAMGAGLRQLVEQCADRIESLLSGPPGG